MAFVTVEDLYGSIDCLAFPKIYEKARGFLRQDVVVRVAGKLSIDPDKLPVIVLDSIEEFEARPAGQPAPSAGKTGQVLWLDARALGEEDFGELSEMLAGYEGATTAKILHGGKRYELKVNVSRAFLAELRTFLPESAIKLL